MTKREFKKTVIEMLGLEDMPIDLQEELVDEVSDTVLQSLVVYAMENMNGTDCQKLAGYLDQDEDIEKFFSFINEKVPNVDRVLKTEILKYAHS